jgi:putative serine protease PepD
MSSVQPARRHKLQYQSAIPVTGLRQKFARVGTFIGRAFTVATLFVAISFAVAVLVHSPAIGEQSSLPGADVPHGAVNFSAPDSVEQVAAKVLPSMVTLETKVGDESESGSGIVLSPDGLIMTNSHVVAPIPTEPPASASSVVTFYDGRTAEFSVVASDPTCDVAIVRAQGITGLIPVSVGSSASLRVGQKVAALGSPLGLQDTVTTGIISALNRPVVTLAGSDLQLAAFDAIQTDAALNPGSSGGALVNMDGELIGMNSAIATVARADGSGGVRGGSIGIGFAIPVGIANRIAAELIATGKATHGWLGVDSRADKNSRGARISRVADGSPAAAAGLPVDALITKVDDQLIESPNALVAAVRSKVPGARIVLGIVDPSGTNRTILVTLGNDQERG